MKKVILLLCIFALSLFNCTSCVSNVKDAMKRYEKDKYVYLVAGFDEAASNTDVLLTVSYDVESATARVAQIPRDTYYNFGKSQNKINQLYSNKISEGMKPSEALKQVSEEIAGIFGTKFDGYAGLTINTFKKIVDAIGGVDIEISEDMMFCLDSDSSLLVLNKGINHINGEDAEKFVRFRSSYAMGDLGRIDAQKLFLNALFKKISSGLNFSELLSVAASFEKDIITGIKLADAFNALVNILSDKREKTVYYATLPGEPAVSKNGISFYVLNRKSAAEMVSIYMFATEIFDKKLKCLNESEVSFANIYEDDTITYREYTNKNLADMHIISER